MGRYVSLAIAPTINYGIRDVKPGFGTGSFRFFGVSGTFTVPAGVSEVRITALGAGGCGAINGGSGNGCKFPIGGGGGGGGYVVACAAVTAGCVCNVAAGAVGGGASCFGSIVYAYGGCNASTECPGAGGNFCACSGSTCVVGRNGNCGCTGFCFSSSGDICCGALSYDCGMGGASGSPIGGGGVGPFPGTSCADIFNCKGFNGEDSTESDLATKFGNVIRWPGDAILGTSRLATSIGATAAGFPMQCYCVSSFGGGRVICGCCPCAAALCCSPIGFASAGFGGGSSGCRVTRFCAFAGTGYQSPSLNYCCGCPCDRGFRGNPGTGYVVVEF